MAIHITLDNWDDLAKGLKYNLFELIGAEVKSFPMEKRTGYEYGIIVISNEYHNYSFHT